jgi:HAD superfamily hydrolase (TIGR01509 family)
MAPAASARARPRRRHGPGQRQDAPEAAPTAVRATGRDVGALPRVVLFDMDDTLFDHTFSLRRGLAAVWREDDALRRRTLTSTVAEYERLLDEIHPDVLQGRKTHAEARQERFGRLFEWVGSRRELPELAEVSNRYRAVYQQVRRPVDGAVPLLRALRGHARIGVVTNNHTAEQRDKIEAIGLGPFLDFLVTSEDAGAEKPDPAIFRAALSRAGTGPERAVMVGDNWVTDIGGARAAGVRAVWLNRRRSARPEPADEVLEVASLRPIPPLREHLLTR